MMTRYIIIWRSGLPEAFRRAVTAFGKQQDAPFRALERHMAGCCFRYSSVDTAIHQQEIGSSPSCVSLVSLHPLPGISSIVSWMSKSGISCHCGCTLLCVLGVMQVVVRISIPTPWGRNAAGCLAGEGWGQHPPVPPRTWCQHGPHHPLEKLQTAMNEHGVYTEQMCGWTECVKEGLWAGGGPVITAGFSQSQLQERSAREQTDRQTDR